MSFFVCDDGNFLSWGDVKSGLQLLLDAQPVERLGQHRRAAGECEAAAH
jgi:hypothetical protein